MSFGVYNIIFIVCEFAKILVKYVIHVLDIYILDMLKQLYYVNIIICIIMVVL